MENNFPAFTAEQISAIVSSSIKSLIKNEVTNLMCSFEKSYVTRMMEHISELNKKIDSLEQRFNQLDGDLYDFKNEVDIDSIKDKVNALEDRIDDLEDDNGSLERKIDELEYQSIDLEDFDEFNELKEKVETLESVLDSANDVSIEAHERTDAIPKIEQKIDKVKAMVDAHNEFIFAFKTFAKESSSDI